MSEEQQVLCVGVSLCGGATDGKKVRASALSCVFMFLGWLYGSIGT